MKWISELELTRGEKAILVSILCFAETDIAPTMENIGNFAIDFSKEVLKEDWAVYAILTLDEKNQAEATNLIGKLYERQ